MDYKIICTIVVAMFSVVANAITYPIQEFRIGIYNTNRSVSKATDEYLTSSIESGGDSEKFHLNFVKDGVFEILNKKNELISIKNNVIVFVKESDENSTLWSIRGVQKDFDGYFLYYKIVSMSDTNLALTFKPNSNSFALESYANEHLQKFKLNLDGLEGYGANIITQKGEKAGTIGGLLGETVFVSNADELIKQLDDVKPKTIVVTENIDMRKYSHTRIRDCKTLVGSFEKHTLYDPYFRTNNEWGKDEPSDNIIIKNFKLIAKNEPNRILINVWSSRQIWIDHIYFESQLIYDRNGNGQDEVGKFIWINTPYETYADKKDRLRSPDYVTISYCHFKNRYWTVAYGTQNDEYKRDRTTLLYNWWDKNVRRCPQLGNGIAHIYNNYYSAYGESQNGNATTGIIGGDNSEMVSMNNRFNGYSLRQAFTMGSNANDPARDDNSYISTKLDATPLKANFTPVNKSKLVPEVTDYGYSLLDAYNTKGTDTKDFCIRYAGDQSNLDNLKYITDKEFDNWVKVRYKIPFLRDLAVGDEPVIKKNGMIFDENSLYVLQNANSGYYLSVKTPLENENDVIQGNEFVWNFTSKGDGYYLLSDAENKKFFLNIENGDKSNGANLKIKVNVNNEVQYFKFVQIEDSVFEITTANTGDKSCLGIGFASKDKEASVIQWTCDGSLNQKWRINKKDSNTMKLLNTNTYKVNSFFNNNFLNVFSSIDEPTDIFLYNIKGELMLNFKILEKGNSSFNIEKNIPRGIYYVKFQNEKFSKIIRVNKN